MVAIRLSRSGSKDRPYYHIVVADSRSRRDGRCIEQIGNYNPMTKGDGTYDLDVEKYDDWLSKGARPSDTVKSIAKKMKKKATAS